MRIALTACKTCLRVLKKYSYQQDMKRGPLIYLLMICRSAVAQLVEHPSKGPRSQYNSTDVGSNHAAA